MTNLETYQTYSKRCLYGDHINDYLLRDTNVNSNIKDDDIYRIASRNMGEISTDYCDDCKRLTAQMTVAYSVDSQEVQE